MEDKKNEEKIKVRPAISSNASSDAPMIGWQKHGSEILEKVKDSKEIEQRLKTLMEYQHKWNTYMKGPCEENKINISILPIVHASLFATTSRVIEQKKNDKLKETKAKSAMVSTPKNPPPRSKKSEEEKEDLGGTKPLTRDFSMTNASSEETNWQI